MARSWAGCVIFLAVLAIALGSNGPARPMLSAEPAAEIEGPLGEDDLLRQLLAETRSLRKTVETLRNRVEQLERRVGAPDAEEVPSDLPVEKPHQRDDEAAALEPGVGKAAAAEPLDGVAPPRFKFVEEEPAGKFTAWPEPALPSAERINFKLRELDGEVRRLTKLARVKEARALDEKIALLRKQLEGTAPVDGRGRPELHVVGIYESSNNHEEAGSAEVIVKHCGAPVVLCLTAYELTNWTVKIAPMVELQQIIVGGHQDHRVVDRPEGVPVSYLTHPRAKDRAISSCYGRDQVDSSGSHFAHLARQLKECTGLNIASIQGTYRPDGVAFVVGSASAAWREDFLLADIDRLHAEALEEQRLAQRGSIEMLQFDALWLGDDGSASFGPFSPRGPLIAEHKPTVDRVSEVICDPTGAHWFGLGNHEVVTFDPVRLEKSVVEVRDVPPLSWLSAIAFDSKRSRVLASTFGGGGYLYAYNVEKGNWEIVRKPGLDAGAMTYVAKDDAIYSINNAAGPGDKLKKINKHTPEGVLISTVDLSIPIPCNGSAKQLRWVADKLVLLTGYSDPHHGPRAKPAAAVIEPKTGEVVYYGYMEPQVE